MAKSDYPTGEIENADDAVNDGYKIIEVVEKDAKGVETKTYDVLNSGKLAFSTVTKPLAMAWLTGYRAGQDMSGSAASDKTDDNKSNDTSDNKASDKTNNKPSLAPKVQEPRKRVML